MNNRKLKMINIIFLIAWLILLICAVLCSIGIIPNRTPTSIAYLAIITGTISSLIQLYRNRD